MTLRVLFVSKPIAPPFRDGTKCLVRDVSLHLRGVRPIVMTSAGAPPLEQVACPPTREGDPPPGATVELARAYSSAGSFAPTLRENARAALWLLARSRADLWHFVFAPNPRTSRVARWLRRVRRVPVLQTVASPPRDFTDVQRLLFGDLVVAQSRWTRKQLQDAGAVEQGVRIEVIPPPVGCVRERSPAAIRAQRRELEIADGVPLFVYPGDLEVSGGAEAVAAAVEPVARELPDARFVFACRHKTAAGPLMARALARRLGPERVRFAPDSADVLTLISGATAVLFPVDDLWGKVDLPIVLLESMSLGIPVVAPDHGPLGDLQGALLIAAQDQDALVRAALELARTPELRGRIAEAQRDAVRTRFSADIVAAQYERLYQQLARPERMG